MPPRKIVVTGATKGIGRAMVGGFIEAGHQVAGCGRSAEAIAELNRRFGRPHRFDVVDVTQAGDIQQWGEQVLSKFGTPDLLINNAAVITENSPLWKVPVDDFSLVIDVNVKGVFHVITALVPAMVARGEGIIVNLSSGWGRSTSPEVGPYCASKFAVEGMTKALAEELPEGMAAIPLSPGVIHTELLEKCFSSGASSYPSPAEWAVHAVPFLLSLGPDDNGQSISITG